MDYFCPHILPHGDISVSRGPWLVCMMTYSQSSWLRSYNLFVLDIVFSSYITHWHTFDECICHKQTCHFIPPRIERGAEVFMLTLPYLCPDIKLFISFVLHLPTLRWINWMYLLDMAGVLSWCLFIHILPFKIIAFTFCSALVIPSIVWHGSFLPLLTPCARFDLNTLRAFMFSFVFFLLLNVIATSVCTSKQIQ